MTKSGASKTIGKAQTSTNTKATPKATMASTNGNLVATNIQRTNPIPTNHPTDSYLPSHLVNLIPELDSYQQLIEAEKKLDVYLARKKIDIFQSISQWNNSKQAHRDFSHHDKDQNKYLRVYISNIAENQPWQDNSQTLETGSWTMRIEGRLLDSQTADDASRPKFSSYIQDIAVDFKLPNKVNSDDTSEDNDVDMVNGESNDITNDIDTSNTINLPLKSPDANNPVDGSESTETKKPLETPTQSPIYDAVEWHFDAKNPVDFDGLDIKRPGTSNVNCTVTIQLKGFTGDNLEYSSDLSLLIGKSQGSLHEAIYSIYKYILLNNLLVDNKTEVISNSDDGNSTTNGEKTYVKLDEFLCRLLPENADKDPFSTDLEDSASSEKKQDEEKTLKLSELPNLVNSHIAPIKPIKTDYVIRVDKATTYGELVFDIEVPDITQLQNPAGLHPNELSTEGMKLLSELDELSNQVQPRLDDLEKQSNNLLLQLNASADKYYFFKKMATNPVPALQEYMRSSANALKVLSGDEGFNEDTVRRAQFYKDNEGILFENLGVLLANGRL
ncbi:similar to Saccharomyces cerevisiae YCR052W RSC6 Component of the RSC chromatin remodeling complex [Maudiozyma saulgeensis]|uniref:Similar to Saccharomyces cerevisiae YCR052W RSC6 Component of the RSC chromatin remodeling complex n=1 Tax=Maudiozyma saulgeensis TaxID=1789683 RepID=A0A1X7QYU1_9SACH|nr:similar to Saccharomyces cerevisiae YCR052W RSC6 Component of the RSC chromatin remodeling complex [Kazachstania saulgeensis]